MSNSSTWTVALRVDALASTEPLIVQFLGDRGVTGRAAYVSQLVVEEIVRNLIEHTPPYAQDENVTVTITVDLRTVVVVIEDRRSPFHPGDAPHLDTESPLDERRAGGMGLHLVRQLTDDLSYEVSDGRNRLTAVVSRE
jgi:anti-sigma regulatory factor (Ser/Thr protein kinase)